MTCWTNDKIDELRTLAQQGLSARQIGIKLSLGRGAIAAKAARAGITLLGDHGQAPRRRSPPPPAISKPVNACYGGANLTDPNRADKLLRRFSWEAQ